MTENKLIQEPQEEVVSDEVVENETSEEVVEDSSTSIPTIDLSAFNKKKFSINGDADKIIELDPSDLNIIQRLNTNYKKLQKLATKAQNQMASLNSNQDDETYMQNASDMLAEIDNEMRECVNAIFDYDVCSVCVPTGSMYDPVNGSFKFEYLVTTLLNLYEDNLTKEAHKIQAKVSKHTDKYTRH